MVTRTIGPVRPRKRDHAADQRFGRVHVRTIPGGDPRPRTGDHIQESGRQGRSNRPGISQYLLPGHVEPGVPDHLPSPQRTGRRRLRTRFSPGTFRPGNPVQVPEAAGYARIRAAARFVRHRGLLRILRKRLSQPGPHPGTRPRAGTRGKPDALRSDRADRRRDYLHQPGAPGGFRRRDGHRRRRRGGLRLHRPLPGRPGTGPGTPSRPYQVAAGHVCAFPADRFSG